MDSGTAGAPGRREVVADVVVFFVVLPVTLAGVHFLVPESAQTHLAVDYAAPELHTLWTSSFVHADEGHLFDNLAGGFGGAFVAYVLCLQAGRRRWFRRTLVAFLTVLPVAVSVSSLAAFAWLGVTPPPGVGFSGVAAGFAGFVLVALLVWLRQFYGRNTVMSVLLLVVIALGLELFWIYGIALDGVSLVVFGGGLVVAGVGVGVDVWQMDGVDQWSEHVGRGVYALVIVCFVGVFVYGLFPSEVVQGDSAVNIVGHAAGFVWGGVMGWILSLNRGQ